MHTRWYSIRGREVGHPCKLEENRFSTVVLVEFYEYTWYPISSSDPVGIWVLPFIKHTRPMAGRIKKIVLFDCYSKNKTSRPRSLYQVPVWTPLDCRLIVNTSIPVYYTSTSDNLSWFCDLVALVGSMWRGFGFFHRHSSVETK